MHISIDRLSPSDICMSSCFPNICLLNKSKIAFAPEEVPPANTWLIWLVAMNVVFSQLKCRVENTQNKLIFHHFVGCWAFDTVGKSACFQTFLATPYLSIRDWTFMLFQAVNTVKLNFKVGLFSSTFLFEHLFLAKSRF